MATELSRVESIFFAALERGDAQERAAYLDAACGDDQELRSRVERLLSAHPQLGNFLQENASPVEVTQNAANVEGPGTTLGRYKLLQQIGEGGFGVVYLADQLEPIHRRVALKIIKPGMDSRQVIARFEAERQALALMDHPNIAKVLDAGTTDTGRPYFVMELVKGVRITEYCDHNRLTLSERLELFVQVCQAIQHAHQKGIIHRDIKPSNVMVTLHDGKPVPKVIDFGVARATDQRLTDKTVFTHYGQIVGTLEYMSPEQAEMSGLDIDTRSDIYSLGILLYELLTGSPPFSSEQLRQCGFDEMMRTIREQEPPKPSQRLSQTAGALATIAANRHLEPAKLTRFLRGELDWIVMKALEKDRRRRYETASSLAADIRRHMDCEPVEAGPPSVRYKFAKFARKNRHWLAAAAAFMGVLMAAVVISSWFALTSSQLRAEAVARAKESEMQRGRAVEATRRAEREAERNRQQAYFTAMHAARQAWEENDRRRTTELLNQQIPQAGQTDLRDFEWYYLRRLLERHQPAWRHDHEGTYSTATSRTGVLAVAEEGAVVLYRFSDGTELVHIDGALSNDPPAGVGSAWFPFAAISGDGRWVAYPQPLHKEDLPAQELCVYDTHTGQSRSLLGHGLRVRTAVFSEDGRTLASATEDGRVILWDTDKWQKTSEHQSHAAPIWAVAISPDGQRIASGAFDNKTVLWDTQTGETTVFEGHFQQISTFQGVMSVAFSPDGKLLASSAVDRTVQVWNVAERTRVGMYGGFRDEIRSVAFSPDGRLLACGGRDRTITLLDLQTRRPVEVIRCLERVVQSIVFSSTGDQIAAAVRDSVRVWDARQLRNQDVLWCSQTPGSLAITPQGDTIATVEYPASLIRLWRLSPTGQEWSDPESVDADGDVQQVVISREAKLGALMRDGRVRLWDLHARTWTESPTRVPTKSSTKPPGFYNTTIQFSADGALLAAGSYDGRIYVWVVNKQEDYYLDGHATEISSLSFSATVTPELLSTDVSGRGVKWDLASRRARREYQDLGFSALSRNGKMIASTKGATVRLWDAETGSLLNTLSTGILSQVRFLDDRTLLGGDRGNCTVKIWDVEAAELRFTLAGHAGTVDRLESTDDGLCVVSSGTDPTIRVWRAPREGKSGALVVQ